MNNFAQFSTNFPRLCVLRVCQQSEKHLDKVLTVDEFVKRIYAVIHSNDPVSDSLLLFGKIAASASRFLEIRSPVR